MVKQLWRLIIISNKIGCSMVVASTLKESSQTNVILQYKLLAAILSAGCSVIQQS